MRKAPGPDRRRRAFAQYGGAISTRGDAALADLLASAWRAAVGEGRELTHGLHPYPARLHPGVARTLVMRLSAAGERVLDPFCGSGTVAVEAFACGRLAIACDVNPVATWLTRAKSAPLAAARRRELERAAAAVTAFARGRARERGDVDPLPREAAARFAPHLRAEWAALATAINRIVPSDLRDRLSLSLSSLLAKVARPDGETGGEADAGEQKRVGAGFLTRWFAERVGEWTSADLALERAAGATPRPAVMRADARALPVRTASIELVVSSPPYPATYDYAGMQRDRARLFRTDFAGVSAREIGGRPARAAAEPEVLARYGADLARALAEIARVLVRGRFACLVVGDAFAGNRVVEAAGLVEEAARRAGLSLVAAASEERPITYAKARGARRRAEHQLLLGR